MRQYSSRWTAAALVVLLGTAVCAPPVMADTRSTSQKSSLQKSSLTTLSPASIEVLRADAVASVRAQQAGSPSESFFGSPKGKVAIALMVAGAAFTIWSINHDRKPVKSPVR